MTAARVSDDQLLQYIRDFTKYYGYAPSIRDIQDALEVASPSTAWARCIRLRDRGKLTWTPGRSRTLQVVEG